jgi:methyl-accepting chemotaxis protein
MANETSQNHRAAPEPVAPPPGTRAVRRIRWGGLNPKLLGTNAAVVVLVAFVSLWQASAALQESLRRSFDSNGEAIALSLAAAAERRAESGMTNLQTSIDSNKVIEGVGYIYVTDMQNRIVAHTFSPMFPVGLETQNAIRLGEPLENEDHTAARVRIREVAYDAGVGARTAYDVAAPVAGGALGTVHVGMDPELIASQVAALRWRLVSLGALVALVGLIGGGLLTRMWVVRPIQELTRITTDIVRRGDLTQQINIRSNDEVGELAETFSRMVEKLREVPVSLSESADLLSDAVERLTGTSTEQTATINRQAAALQEAQTTVQEIKQTSLMAAQKTAAVLEVAERADEVGKSGEGAIEESLNALTDIRSQVEGIAQRITELTDRTRQIGLITETVKDLADQSNMLALNAAIEAVRSGEHGKGFGVVAREIRSLADQSIQATQRVREILEDITTAIRGAVSITEKGSHRMESGLVQVRVSGEKLRELSSIVRDNSAAVRQIAAAVHQQNAGVTQISAAVGDLNDMMGETVNRIDTTNRSVQGLREAAERISTIVRTFRV